MFNRRLTQNPIFRSTAFVAFYFLFYWVFHLVSLSFIAFIVVHSTNAAPNTLNNPNSLAGASSAGTMANYQPNMVQKIGDVLQSSQFGIVTLSAVFFIIIISFMHPLTKTELKSVFLPTKIKSKFAYNSLSGLVLASVLVLCCFLTGYFDYLGIYLNVNEIVFSIISSFLVLLLFFCVCVIEEYLLREVVEKTALMYLEPFHSMCISSLVYLGIKAFQFDLTALQAVNIVLLNMTFSMVCHNERSHLSSALFGTFLLFTLHPLFGLPYMSEEISGIFIFRPIPKDALAEIISGGMAGPEAGLVMTIGLVIYLYLPQIRNRKSF